MPKTPKTETTFIIAVDKDANFNSFEDGAWAFYAIHDKDLDVVEAMKKAFQEWYDAPKPEDPKMYSGREFVDDNGCNWGDATDIPDEFLKKHGIQAYDALAVTKGKRWKIAISEYDHTLTVEHGEMLVEES